MSTSTPVVNDAVPEQRDANADEPDHKESKLVLELGTDRREDAMLEIAAKRVTSVRMVRKPDGDPHACRGA